MDRRTFFLRPGPGLFPRSLPRFRSPRCPGRELSGTTSTTTPNERPQKNSSNLSLPVAYYQSPRQSQIGSVGPVRRTPSSSASTFRNRSAAHTNIRHAGNSYLQVRLSTARLTRDVRTFHSAERRKKYPFTMWIFALPARRLITRKFLPKDGSPIRRVKLPLGRAKCGPIVKIHYGAREYISRAFHLTLLLFVFFLTQH